MSIIGFLGPRLWWLSGKPHAFNYQLPSVTLSRLTWEPCRLYPQPLAAEGDWGGLSQAFYKPRSALQPFLLYFRCPFPEFLTGGRTTSALCLRILKLEIHHIPWGFNPQEGSQSQAPSFFIKSHSPLPVPSHRRKKARKENWVTLLLIPLTLWFICLLSSRLC